MKRAGGKSDVTSFEGMPRPPKIIQGFLGDLRALAGEGEGEEVESRTVATLREAKAALDGERLRTAERVGAAYAERSQAMREVALRRMQRVEAYAQRLRQDVPSEPGKSVIAGRVTDEKTGAGLPNLRVRPVSDRSPKPEDVLLTRTDALGYFRIDFDPEDQEATAADRREVAIEVLDDEGKRLGITAGSVAIEADRSEFIPLVVKGARVPESLELGRAIGQSVDARMQRLLGVEEIEREHPAALGRKLPAPAVEAPRIVVVPASSSGRTAPTAPVSAPPARKAGQEALQEISGVGPVFAARLVEGGITTVREVASADRSQLATSLRIGEVRAGQLIWQARRLVERK